MRKQSARLFLVWRRVLTEYMFPLSWPGGKFAFLWTAAGSWYVLLVSYSSFNVSINPARPLEPTFVQIPQSQVTTPSSSLSPSPCLDARGTLTMGRPPMACSHPHSADLRGHSHSGQSHSHSHAAEHVRHAHAEDLSLAEDRGHYRATSEQTNLAEAQANQRCALVC